MRKGKAASIPVMASAQKRLYTIAFLVVAALFFLASLITQFQPFELLLKMENFWLFIGQDLFPPQFQDGELIWQGVWQTLCMALTATAISAVFALVLAFLGSYSTTPWSPLTKVIRAVASLLRNIPSLIWTFILVMAYGIGTTVGMLALLINTCGFLIRSFIETIDETGNDNLELMKSVGAGYLPTIVQCVIPSAVPGFISWLLYSLEVNIRASTLVGAVGGGGIGLIMMGFIKSFRYHSAMGVILLIAAIVIGVDFLTNYLRKKVLV